VRQTFPDAAEAREVLERYSAATEAEPAFTPDVVDALEALGEEGGKSFPDLKERLADQVRRACCADAALRVRGPTLQRTPPRLRALVPGGGLLPGVYLCENALEQRYLVHYPLDGAALQSISRSWGPAAGRSQETALDLALSWMWARHRQAGPFAPPAGVPGAGEDAPSEVAESEPGAAAGSAAAHCPPAAKGRGHGKRGAAMSGRQAAADPVVLLAAPAPAGTPGGGGGAALSPQLRGAA